MFYYLLFHSSGYQSPILTRVKKLERKIDKPNITTQTRLLLNVYAILIWGFLGCSWTNFSWTLINAYCIAVEHNNGDMSQRQKSRVWYCAIGWFQIVKIISTLSCCLNLVVGIINALYFAVVVAWISLGVCPLMLLFVLLALNFGLY